MDGGTTFNVNLVDAVHRCRDLGVPDTGITIDIINTNGLKTFKGSPGSTIQNYLLSRDLRSAISANKDIEGFIQGFPNVNFRYIVLPTKPLASGLGEMNFDNSSTW